MDGGAAGEAVGRGHCHGAHPVVAEVLLDLAGERGLAFTLDVDRVVDRGELARRELDVDDRPGDLDHPAGGGGGGGRHDFGASSCVARVAQRASAPDAISIISRVMLAWRTLL